MNGQMSDEQIKEVAQFRDVTEEQAKAILADRNIAINRKFLPDVMGVAHRIIATPKAHETVYFSEEDFKDFLQRIDRYIGEKPVGLKGEKGHKPGSGMLRSLNVIDRRLGQPGGPAELAGTEKLLTAVRDKVRERLSRMEEDLSSIEAKPDEHYAPFEGTQALPH